MKKNKISKNWVNKQRRDIYVRQSKVDGYRARSAYKLKEIEGNPNNILSLQELTNLSKKHKLKISFNDKVCYLTK